MFGTDKYLLHAEISPVALAEVAEEYQQWFAAKAEKVSGQQAQLGGDMQMAESNSRIMYQELNELKKEAAVASTRLSTNGAAVGSPLILTADAARVLLSILPSCCKPYVLAQRAAIHTHHFLRASACLCSPTGDEGGDRSAEAYGGSNPERRGRGHEAQRGRRWGG